MTFLFHFLTNIFLLSEFASQMALLGFFRDSSLFLFQKKSPYGQGLFSQRECTHSGVRSRKKYSKNRKKFSVAKIWIHVVCLQSWVLNPIGYGALPTIKFILKTWLHADFVDIVLRCWWQSYQHGLLFGQFTSFGLIIKFEGFAIRIFMAINGALSVKPEQYNHLFWLSS